MTLKSFDEILKEIEEQGFEPLPPNCINGEEYEEWLRKELRSDNLMTKYETMCDTYKHKQLVNKLINQVIIQLSDRAINHDNSKLDDFEANVFAQFTPKLAGCTYGSAEDKQSLKDMKPALDHHYAKNRHHPEHFPNGIKDMNLIDLIEMICDWKASSLRHNDGNILIDIEKNQERFNYSNDMAGILKNTVKRFE